MAFGFRDAFGPRVIASGISLMAITAQLPAQMPRVKTADDPQSSVPALAAIVNRAPSEMADVIERFTADQTSLGRRYDASDSPAQ